MILRSILELHWLPQFGEFGGHDAKPCGARILERFKREAHKLGGPVGASRISSMPACGGGPERSAAAICRVAGREMVYHAVPTRFSTERSRISAKRALA